MTYILEPSPNDPITVPQDIVETVDAAMERYRPRPEPTADLSWDEFRDWAPEAPAAHDDEDFTLH